MDEAGPDESATGEALDVGDTVTAEELNAPLVDGAVASTTGAAEGRGADGSEMVGSKTDESEAETPTLASLLEDGESPRYLLRGAMLDRVPDDGDRRRRVAARDRTVLTLVTDRAVHFVVQYEDRFHWEHLPFDRIRGVAVDAVGTERRVRIGTSGDDFAVYPDAGDGGTLDGVVSVLRDVAAENETSAPSPSDSSVDAAESDGSDDVVSALERLAALHERGQLTDEEFRRAKRDLL